MRWLWALLVWVFLVFPLEAAGDKRTIIIAADIWCPINCEPNAVRLGVGVDLARRVFEKQGYKIQYVVMPWTQALAEVRAGRVHAVIGANSTDDPRLIFPTNPICEIDDDFYVLADNPWQYTGPLSLVGMRLGVAEDYGYSNELAAHIERSKNIPAAVQWVTGNDALQANIQKLLRKEIDMLVDGGPIVEWKLKEMGLADKIRHAGTIRQDFMRTDQGFVFLAFSPRRKESAELARVYDEGIDQLKGKGHLDVIYQNYGMTPH